MSSWTEPEWDDEQVSLVLAEQRLTRLTGANGEYLPEATSDDADPNNYVYRYVASGPFTNWAEKERLDARDAYLKAAGEDANTNGKYWTVDRFDY